MKRPLLFVIGIASLIGGIVLVLAWWPHVVHLFQGMIGIILAIAGLFIIYSLKIK